MLKIGFSCLGIIYVWTLPILAELGFAEKNATSISGFIANPPATGAMAALSFAPITLMWLYQHYKFNKMNMTKIQHYLLETTLSLYQLFYSMFLICTENYVNQYIHITSVILFGLSFIVHGWSMTIYLRSNKLAIVTLSIGSGSFLTLLFVRGMWFWFFECISYTSMILFTPALMSDEPEAPFNYISL